MSGLKHIWTDEKLNFLHDNFKTMTNADIAIHLEFPLPVVKNKIWKLGLKGKTHEMTGYMKKGHSTWNKGFSLPTVGRMAETQFKKGQEPHNTRYDGAIRRQYDKRWGLSYLMIRTAKAKWEGLHRVTWRQHNGEIPKGFIIVFKDGDTQNCDISNLECISRADNVRRNYNRKKAAESLRGRKKTLEMLDNDNFIAGKITKDKELKKIIRQDKELLDIKRNLILSQMEVRQCQKS